MIQRRLLIFLFLLVSNCTGFYANDFYYRKDYSSRPSFDAKKPPKIAIDFNPKKQTESSFENLRKLQSTFELENFPFTIVTSPKQLKSYDLVINDYTIEDSDGILNTIEESNLILTYAYMILTLGIFPGMNHYTQFHTIKVYNPALEQEFTIQFTESIRKHDGWISNYVGKKEGKYNPKYDRYYITTDSAKVHGQKLINMIIIEGVIPK